MTCGIHLYIEKRNRKRNTNWYQSSFRGEYTDIVYGMFAALNNVRNHWDIKPLEKKRTWSGLRLLNICKLLKERKKIM